MRAYLQEAAAISAMPKDPPNGTISCGNGYAIRDIQMDGKNNRGIYKYILAKFPVLVAMVIRNSRVRFCAKQS